MNYRCNCSDSPLCFFKLLSPRESHVNSICMLFFNETLKIFICQNLQQEEEVRKTQSDFLAYKEKHTRSNKEVAYLL